MIVLTCPSCFGRYAQILFMLILLWNTIPLNPPSWPTIHKNRHIWMSKWSVEKSRFLQRLYFSIYYFQGNVCDILAIEFTWGKKKIWFTTHSDTNCSSFIIPIKAKDCWFSVFLSHQGLHFAMVAFAVYVEFCALLRTFWTLINWSPVAINRITVVWGRSINFTRM